MISYDSSTRKYLLKHLKEMMFNDRWARFHQVLDQRTKHITVVLEDIFQPHNASAVIRTCELKGIQDLHIIENRNPYNVNPDIVVGSNKWIDLTRYNKHEHNTFSCFQSLKKAGYQVVATSPHKDDCLIHELPLDQKTALVFGNEGDGLSDVALENADAFVRIPSCGFTESYNLSVSVAICLYELTARLKKEVGNWQLTPEEKEVLLLKYALNTVRNPQIITKNLLQKKESKKSRDIEPTKNSEGL